MEKLKYKIITPEFNIKVQEFLDEVLIGDDEITNAKRIVYRDCLRSLWTNPDSFNSFIALKDFFKSKGLDKADIVEVELDTKKLGVTTYVRWRGRFKPINEVSEIIN